MTPTPEQLAAVLRYPNAPRLREDYEGGFTTKDWRGDDAVRVSVGGDENGVHLHTDVSAGVGGGSSSAYTRMTPSEALELALALELAAKAAKA